MSWLDNVVAWISPEAGAKRAAWRATYNELRNYDAGNNSRLNAGWRAANYSAEMTDRTSRDTIRARARDLERNSDIANSLISAYKRNVIGAGYNLQAKTKNAKLNADIENSGKMVQGKELRRDRNADLEPDTPNGSDQEEGGWRNSIREGLHQRRNDPVQTSDDRG